eukprot:jgi/Chlat1/5170/Chrsp33S00392
MEAVSTRVFMSSVAVSSSARCSGACSHPSRSNVEAASAVSRRGAFCGQQVTGRPHSASLHSSPAAASASPRRTPTVAAVRVSTARTVVLTATLVAKEGARDEVMQLCKDVVNRTKETQMQPGSKSGVISYECSEDGYEPGVFHFWERYTSQQTMTAHLQSEEHKTFVAKLLSKPIAMCLYEYKDGQLGPVAYPLGPKGEGGLDDATGQGGMAGGAGMKQHAQVDLGMVERDSWGLDKMLKSMTSILGGKK